MNMVIVVLCCSIIGVLIAMILGFLVGAGSVLSRAEEEYWCEAWDGTPVIGDSEESVACNVSVRELKKAA